MELIDDEGNLFGAVNVVDALVILLVLAVGIAGAAFVFIGGPGSGSETETTYATVDLGEQPGYIVEAINEGDTYNATESSQATITDVHLTPQGDDVRVFLRVELQGQINDDQLTYANAPPRLGRSITITTDLYEVSGQIREVGDSDALDRAQTAVVIQDTIAAADAADIASGDEIRIAGRTVATVEDVAVYATADPTQRRVFVEATVDAHRQQGDLRFGGTLLRRGQSLSLSTADYTLGGTIEQVGGELDLGTTEQRTVTLRMDEVREDMADSISPGLREQVGGNTVANVTAVKTEPSIIIATGDNGVSIADHPFNRDVTLTTELRVRQTSTGLQFKGEPLRQGSTVVLDLGTVTVEATVVSVGS
ncbi:DUF4330 family protein [Halorubrum sp. FL23]|uniref:DUF4330 family protein n=1 Tax=Halorubrum sp. FL23 TaxID=3458704 RepID=UPI0040343A42